MPDTPMETISAPKTIRPGWLLPPLSVIPEKRRMRPRPVTPSQAAPAILIAFEND
jgi:hypothetical protein